MNHFEPPIHWNDHEDIALKLYERFGDDFNEGKIYRIRFTDLLEWVLQIPNFQGKREESNEGHLEMIQSAWVYGATIRNNLRFGISDCRFVYGKSEICNLKSAIDERPR
jgi:FeS assembly protein IscX